MRKQWVCTLLTACMVCSSCNTEKSMDATDEFTSEVIYESLEKDLVKYNGNRGSSFIDYPQDYKESIDKLSFSYNISYNTPRGYKYSHTNTTSGVLHVFFTDKRGILVELKQGRNKDKVTRTIKYPYTVSKKIDNTSVIIQGWDDTDCQFAHWTDGIYYFSCDFGNGVKLPVMEKFVYNILKQISK